MNVLKIIHAKNRQVCIVIVSVLDVSLKPEYSLTNHKC